MEFYFKLFYNRVKRIYCYLIIENNSKFNGVMFLMLDIFQNQKTTISMTQQLSQSISLLQYSVMELKEFIMITTRCLTKEPVDIAFEELED